MGYISPASPRADLSMTKGLQKHQMSPRQETELTSDATATSSPKITQ